MPGGFKPPAARAARTLGAVTTLELLELAHYWTYRLGGFVVLHLLDDPAWLALMFC
jgi:hypothetical protein